MRINFLFILDGWANVDGKRVGVDFHGCRFHPHNCGVQCILTPEEIEKQQFRKKYLMEQLDIYHECYECDFRNLNYQPNGNFYKFLFKDEITPDDIIRSVQDESFYGFVCVDISSPDHVINRYKTIGMPLIFQNLDLEKEHLSPPMQEMAETHGVRFPRRNLCITFNATNILLNTELLLYYLEVGMVVDKVYYAIEYLPGAPFGEFVRELTDMRIQATHDMNNGNVVQGQTKTILAKLLLNSSYGKLGQNLAKRENVIYCRESQLHKHENSILFKRKQPMVAEYDMDLIEVVKIKRSQTDTTPVVCALTILQMAKLVMLRFVHFLLDHLEYGSFSVLYSDTDSVCIATTDDLDNLVRDNMRETWSCLKERWFAKDETPEEQRAPGKFKIEWSTKTGSYCATSSKCYMLKDSDNIKKSAKGVPPGVDLDYNTYLQSVYNGKKRIMRDITSINYSRSTQTMVTKQTTKKCINSCYMKFRVAQNFNNLYPLKIDNKYV